MAKTTSNSRRAKLEALRIEKKELEQRMAETENRLQVTQRMLASTRKDNQKFRERLMELEGRALSAPKRLPCLPTAPVSAPVPARGPALKTAAVTQAVPKVKIKDKISADAKKAAVTLQQHVMKRKPNEEQRGPKIIGGFVKRSSSTGKVQAMNWRKTIHAPVTPNVTAAKTKPVVASKPESAFRRGVTKEAKPKTTPPQAPVEFSLSKPNCPPCKRHMFRLSKHTRQECLKCKQPLGPYACWGCVVCGSAVHLRCRA